MPDPATLNTGENNLELPFVQATQGNNGYDVSKLEFPETFPPGQR